MATEDKKARQIGQNRLNRKVPTAPPQGSCDKVSTPKEVDGPSGLEPTRYGDWEKNGRCIDF